MEVTQVSIYPAATAEAGDRRLKAFARVVLDGMIVIEDIRIIRSAEGRLILAMPSRKRHDHCPTCASKTNVTDRFCWQCGCRLADDRAKLDREGRPILHSDVCYPISAEARAILERAILGAYAAHDEAAHEAAASHAA